MACRTVMPGRNGCSPGLPTSPATYTGRYSTTLTRTSSARIVAMTSRPSPLRCWNTLVGRSLRKLARTSETSRGHVHLADQRIGDFPVGPDRHPLLQVRD